MFMHVFTYRLKCLVRNRQTVFWTLFFSLLLATMFCLAFGHLTSEREKFEPIKAAAVDNQAYREDVRFRQVLEHLSQPGDNQILDLVIVGKQEAEKLLEEGAVFGIIAVGGQGGSNPGAVRTQGGQAEAEAETETDVDTDADTDTDTGTGTDTGADTGTDTGTDTITLTVKERGLSESILKAILDEYVQASRTVASILATNPGAARQLAAELQQRKGYTEQVSFSDAVPDTMLGFFYALIAMACLYSSFWGLRNTVDVQADLSSKGARRSVAPTHKLKVVVADAAAALVVSFAEVLALIAYMGLALKVRFGSQLGYVVLTCLTGCIAGVSLGHFIGTYVRGSEGFKTGIMIGANMAMSFLAGLMWVDIKHIVHLKAPVLAYINPATLIADAFYSLYVFDTHRRFFLNIGLLCLISAVLCTASFLRLRRERYASI